MVILQILGFILLAALAVAGLSGFLASRSSGLTSSLNPCSKDPTKKCPYRVEITSRGGMRSYNHLQCCKVIDQYKAMNNMIANAKPGKSYGEFSFSKEIIEEAKKDNDKIQAVDSSGPRNSN